MNYLFFYFVEAGAQDLKVRQVSPLVPSYTLSPLQI
jgi:hypothetical protein